MNTKWKQLGLVLLFASANVGLTACSTDQIYGDDSFNESSLEYADGEDQHFDIDAQAAQDLNEETQNSVQAIEPVKMPNPTKKAKDKPKATAAKKKKESSL